MELVGGIHFLRPLWLLAVPVTLLLWAGLRRPGNVPRPWSAHIAPHLFEHLLVNRKRRYRAQCADFLLASVLLLALAAAGPTWQRQPSPWLVDSAPLVVVLKVSTTMLASDVQPNRLERAKQNVLDLLALRAGARTALVAYAGSAHLVLPFTDDPATAKSFVESLAPDIMPVPGQNAAAALTLAAGTLASANTRGSILFVTDGIESADIPAFERHRRGHGADVVALVVGTGVEGSVPAAARGRARDFPNKEAASGKRTQILERWEHTGGVDIIPEQVGSGDIRAIERTIESNFRRSGSQTERTPWDDRGWVLLWPAAVVVLTFFRRGWTLYGVLLIAWMGTLTPPSAAAAGFWELWLTPDQQGRLAYERSDYAEAARLFEDPMWTGIAEYRRGRYDAAVKLFARVSTVDGRFNMGNALLKERKYTEASQAYRGVLSDAPDHAAARRNLELAEIIIARMTDLRSAVDTAEKPDDLGADQEHTEAAKDAGNTVLVDQGASLTVEASEQWMRLVDTRAADFLRLRFAREAAREIAP